MYKDNDPETVEAMREWGTEQQPQQQQQHAQYVSDWFGRAVEGCLCTLLSICKGAVCVRRRRHADHARPAWLLMCQPSPSRLIPACDAADMMWQGQPHTHTLPPPRPLLSCTHHALLRLPAPHTGNAAVVAKEAANRWLGEHCIDAPSRPTLRGVALARGSNMPPAAVAASSLARSRRSSARAQRHMPSTMLLPPHPVNGITNAASTLHLAPDRLP